MVKRPFVDDFPLQIGEMFACNWPELIFGAHATGKADPKGRTSVASPARNAVLQSKCRALSTARPSIAELKTVVGSWENHKVKHLDLSILKNSVPFIF